MAIAATRAAPPVIWARSGSRARTGNQLGQIQPSHRDTGGREPVSDCGVTSAILHQVHTPPTRPKSFFYRNLAGYKSVRLQTKLQLEIQKMASADLRTTVGLSSERWSMSAPLVVMMLPEL
jgi:hypothetical protein